MNKIKIAGLVAAAAMLLPMFASAATISNARFSNNDVTIDAAGNSTVQGTFTLTVAQNEAIEWGRATVNGITTDFSIGGNLGAQEGVTNNVPFSVKVPPNTGTYSVDLTGDGIYGASRAVSPVDVNANSWMGSTNVGQVRVVANGSDSTTVGGDAMPSWLAALLAALKPATPPAPTVSAQCAEFSSDLAGLSVGSTGDGVAKLQAFLLSKNPNAIPLIRSGAATYGYFGNQTNSAVSSFRGSNGCN